MRQIINNVNSVIEQVKFKKKNDNMNILNVLVKQFQQQIDKIELSSKDESKKIFKHLNIINNNYIANEIDDNINVKITNNYFNILFYKT